MLFLCCRSRDPSWHPHQLELRPPTHLWHPGLPTTSTVPIAYLHTHTPTSNQMGPKPFTSNLRSSNQNGLNSPRQGLDPPEPAPLAIQTTTLGWHSILFRLVGRLVKHHLEGHLLPDGATKAPQAAASMTFVYQTAYVCRPQYPRSHPLPSPSWPCIACKIMPACMGWVVTPSAVDRPWPLTHGWRGPLPSSQLVPFLVPNTGGLYLP